MPTKKKKKKKKKKHFKVGSISCSQLSIKKSVITSRPDKFFQQRDTFLLLIKLLGKVFLTVPTKDTAYFSLDNKKDCILHLMLSTYDTEKIMLKT